MQTRLEFYSSQGKVIVAGYLNAQVSWPSCNAAISGSIYKLRMLNEMVHKYHLVPLELTSLYSFISTKAMIDHILVDRSLENISIDCRVVNDGEWVLTSDHFPIAATIGLREVTPTETGLGTESLQRNDMVAWRKITNDDISRHQSHIETALEHSPHGNVSPNVLSDRITNILHTAAENSLPHNRLNKHLKPYWTADVKEAHKIARYNRRLWIAEGRPRGPNFVSYTN